MIKKKKKNLTPWLLNEDVFRLNDDGGSKVRGERERGAPNENPNPRNSPLLLCHKMHAFNDEKSHKFSMYLRNCPPR